MLNSTNSIVAALKAKGFSEEDAKLMAEEADREDTCYKIDNQKDKINVMLALFCWSDSSQGQEFWLAKYIELEKEAGIAEQNTEAGEEHA
jgi:hypothetical protein